MNHPPAANPLSAVAPLPPRSRSVFRAIIWALCLLACNFLAALSASAQIYTNYLPNNAGAAPLGVTVGPDGAYWFTLFQGGAIARIDTNGYLTEPFGANGAWNITVGPDHNLWFTQLYSDSICRISPGADGTYINGVLAQFPIHPYVNTNSEPAGITAGPDGNIWFTEFVGNAIGKMSTNGQMLGEFGAPTIQPFAQIFSITAGLDHALWFADSTYGKIGRITTNGQINEIPLPNANCQPYDIILGPDGAFWFTEYNYNRIGRLTTTSNYSDFVLPSVGPSAYNYSQDPYYLTVGSDGNIWFTEWVGGNVARLVPSTGLITEYPVLYGTPTGIACGVDKSIWFGNYNANALDQFILAGLTITTTNSQFVLSWWAGASAYTLQGNSNLTTGTWINLTSPPPVIVSNAYVYTNTITNLDFFRLILSSPP